jgi:hypothetical protein
MKTIVVLILIGAVCAAGTCKQNPLAESFTRLSVKNESEQGIFFLVSENYPDTSILDTPQLYGVAPNEIRGKDYSLLTPLI